MTLPSFAITGYMRSGKDAVAAYLCERHGYTRFAFGDELKRYANEIFNVEEGTKPRELYQWFGQTMRQRDPDVWVRKCFAEIQKYHVICEVEYESGYANNLLRAVITDLRQPNEYARCRAEGYVIIRVKAPEALRIQRAIESADTFNLSDLTHETELHVDSFEVDYEITNDGTLAELYAKVEAILCR